MVMDQTGLRRRISEPDRKVDSVARNYHRFLDYISTTIVITMTALRRLDGQRICLSGNFIPKRRRGLWRLGLAVIGLLLSATIGFTPRAQENHFRFKHLTIDDGLSQNLVYAILQDRKGFMWFGTKDGLNRYDGYLFTVFQHDPFDATSISGQDVNLLYQDKDGNLWIGATGLNRFDPMTERFERFLHDPKDPNTITDGMIHSICEDPNRSGVFWVGSSGGLNRLVIKGVPQPERFSVSAGVTRYLHDPENPQSLISNRVRSVLVDHSNVLWVGTEKGLNATVSFKTDSINFVSYTREARPPYHIPEDLITYLFEDTKGNLWAGTPSGLLFLDRKRIDQLSQFKYYPYPSGAIAERWRGMIVAIHEMPDGTLWLGTMAGLVIFNPITVTFQYIRNNPSDPQSISMNHILSICQDQGGVLWFGTGGKGLNKLVPHNKDFHCYGSSIHCAPTQEALSVGAILEDRSGLLWVNANAHLYRIERATGRWWLSEITAAAVGSMIEDRQGVYWFTLGEELLEYDSKTKRITRHRHVPGEENSLPSNAVWQVLEGHDGSIRVITAGVMVSRLDRASRRMTHARIPQTEKVTVHRVHLDTSGTYWLGSDAGLICFNPTDSSVAWYRNDPQDPSSLSYDVIYSILPDPREPNRFLWLGTAGGGLNCFDVVTGTFSHYTEKDGLPNNVVYGILPDRRGRLWLSTNRGLSVFDPQIKTFRNFDVRDGLQSNEFNRKAYFLSQKGEMFFGGINGLNVFYPDSIRDNPHAPPIVITDFQLAYQSVSFRDPGSPLRQPISETDEIRLAYHQNTIAFEFAAMDFTEPSKNQYAYQLENFNPQWVLAGPSRKATYTNLPPGKYVFRVKGSNNDGVWNEKGASIRIIIAPPFWKTWWAYASYLILAVGAVIGIVKGRVRRLEKRTRELEAAVQQRTAEVVAHEQQLAVQADKLRELDHIKSSFFANISHEFRTPLTLILGPVQRMISDVNEINIKHELVRIQKNGQRLLRLVNQLLDLSKLETGKMTVQVRQGNIIPLLRGITMSFASLAEQKHINLCFHCATEEIISYFDRDKIEKIFYNLLSNAFKFTPEGGSVDVVAAIDNIEERRTKGEEREAETDASSPLATPYAPRSTVIRITVKDTGIGIPSDRLPRIFDRFYQIDPSSTREHEGTGIGLSLVQELVTLHHGRVEVASVEGQGSTFTVRLPMGRETFDGGEIVGPGMTDQATDDTSVIKDLIDLESTVSEPTRAPGQRECTNDEMDTIVLVVDDHADVRAYIREYLEASYKVIEAGDGAEGVEKAREFIPDLIVGDVMMPKMDGYEMCQALKTDERTSHIPVILLTARAALEDKVAGLKTGADDYLTKPFDAVELLARVENLIESRRKLRERWKQTVILKPGQVATTPVDQAFLEKALAIAEKNLGDEEFSIEAFAYQVGMSRSQLHRKLHALTNQSASLFLRSVRLQRAVQLLRQRAGTIAEIAYQAGFSSQAHFNRCFKEQFGCSPKEYVGKID